MDFWAKITQIEEVRRYWQRHKHKTLRFDESKIGLLFYKEQHDMIFSLDIQWAKIKLNLPLLDI